MPGARGGQVMKLIGGLIEAVESQKLTSMEKVGVRSMNRFRRRERVERYMVC